MDPSTRYILVYTFLSRVSGFQNPDLSVLNPNLLGHALEVVNSCIVLAKKDSFALSSNKKNLAFRR